MSVPLAFLSAPGPMEMLVIGAIAVLLFGKRLPDVGRSLGKSIMEFKKGLNGIEDEFRSIASTTTSTTSKSSSSSTIDDHEEATAPKFEPPAAEPQPEAPSQA